MAPTASVNLGRRENQQSQSLFFCVLPTEIRLQIYRSAMEEGELALRDWSRSDLRVWPRWAMRHDFRVHDSHDNYPDEDTLLQGLKDVHRNLLREVLNAVGNPSYSWVRPGYQGPKTVTTDLLCTCRKAYREARHIPMQTREVCLWFGDGPDAENRDPPVAFFLHGLSPYQRNQIRSVHLFTRHFWLSDPVCFWDEVVATSLFRRIQHLRITIRRDDWEEKATAPFLVIYPYWKGLLTMMGLAMEDAMQKTSEWQPEEHGECSPPQTGEDGKERPGWMPPIDFTDAENECRGRGWGLALGHMPNLQSLTMDFDVEASKRNEMEILAQWMARVWRFPLNPRIHGYHYLSAEDTSIQRTAWHGGPNLWRRVCGRGYCQGLDTTPYPARATADDPFYEFNWPDITVMFCDRCGKIADHITRASGPQMFTWTIKWTGKPWKGASFYDYFPNIRPRNWNGEEDHWEESEGINWTGMELG